VELMGGTEDWQNLLLKELKRDHSAKGSSSSYRWAVAATRAGNLELQLQVLPLPLPTIEVRQQLVDDKAAAVVVARWDIATPVFNGAAGLSGPVPTLFTEQPEELRSKLRRNPDAFLPNLNEAMSR
jgi:hypothetical protein